MSTASEQAAAFLAAKTADGEREGERQGATGEYARLRDLIEKDDLTDDESAEFSSLAEKRRAGTLEGRPRRTVYKRQSVAGERSEDGRPTTAPTASDQAARFLQGHNS
ncbi:hypothetical protein RN51_00441 [Microbacterium oxydans]|uniref:Uncharacterized protein n=1 Tax=Microbacterium oxydans TaxID=82380 RepID=A0A0F0KZS2_9MICO|nr:hypothetical protein [Microbacterium oxydans]KJL25934.1 hypothetical protein RN51_00441 [Microbacterium oxydans]